MRTCPIYVHFAHLGGRWIGAIEGRDPDEVYRKAKEVVLNGEEPEGVKACSIARYAGYKVQSWCVPDLVETGQGELLTDQPTTAVDGPTNDGEQQ